MDRYPVPDGHAPELLQHDLASSHGEGYPVREELKPDESGHGYALRMATANGLPGIPVLKRMLGKTRFAVLDGGDTPKIARWFGANPTALATALGSTGIGNQAVEYSFCGQALSRKYFINRMHPRVCDLCLREDHYCKSFWEIGLATACPRHSVLLSECCPFCGRGLSWDRPGLEVCQCGSLLTLDPTAARCSALEREVSSWIASKTKHSEDIDINAGRSRDDGVEMQCKLSRLLVPLTLDGGLHLLYALGTAGSYQQTDLPPSERIKSSIAAAQELLFSAANFVDTVGEAEPANVRIKGLTVAIQLLAESTSAKSSSADRSLAQSLISSLLRHRNRSNWKSRHPQLSQMELF